MFARFDENPAMTLHDIKNTKRYGWTNGRTHGHRENSISTTNKVCGCIKISRQQKYAADHQSSNRRMAENGFAPPP